MKKLFLTIFCLFIFNVKAIALVEIDITRGNLDPLPIAVSPLYVTPGSLDIKQGDKIIKNVGEEISKVIELNFRRSGDLQASISEPVLFDKFIYQDQIHPSQNRFFYHIL